MQISTQTLFRKPFTYSLGGLAAVAIAASALAVMPDRSQTDPTSVGVASRIGVDAPLADSLRGLDPDDLSPLEAAALVGVDSARTVWIGREPIALHAGVVPFYRARALAPAWTDIASRDTLLHALRDAALDGLDPETYGASRLAQIAQALDARDPRQRRAGADTVAADFDLALTSALFRYAEDVSGARVDPHRPLPPSHDGPAPHPRTPPRCCTPRSRQRQAHRPTPRPLA